MTRTLKAPSVSTSARMPLRLSWLPSYMMTFSVGAHSASSRAQLDSTALGATIRCGPFTPFFSYR